jgi:hypothetical protein
MEPRIQFRGRALLSTFWTTIQTRIDGDDSVAPLEQEHTMTNEFNGQFTGKVAFVTGAASGIGREAALAFAREGAKVVAADLSEQGNQETARMIEMKGGQAVAVRCDVTRAEDVKAALARTVDSFGRLDFAFNNAGIEPRKPAPTADYDEEEWNRIIDINLRGVFLCMKHEIPLILRSGGGGMAEVFRPTWPAGRMKPSLGHRSLRGICPRQNPVTFPVMLKVLAVICFRGLLFQEPKGIHDAVSLVHELRLIDVESRSRQPTTVKSHVSRLPQHVDEITDRKRVAVAPQPVLEPSIVRGVLWIDCDVVGAGDCQHSHRPKHKQDVDLGAI